MAIEVAKYKIPLKIILLSSVKTKYEIPFYYRWLGKLKLHRWIPDHYLLSSNLILFYFFGITHDQDKLLLSQILKDSNSKFLRWAIDCIIKWENIEIPENIIHIHGNKDKIFPIKNIEANYKIVNQGHFMVISDSRSVQKLLNQIMNQN